MLTWRNVRREDFALMAGQRGNGRPVACGPQTTGRVKGGRQQKMALLIRVELDVRDERRVSRYRVRTPLLSQIPDLDGVVV